MKYRNTSSEVQRLKRGLSYISLKVKEIVNRRKRLTYKEVSDEVLEDVATAMTLHEK